MIRTLVLSAALAAALAAEFFECPFEKATGFYSDPDQCDKYWQCTRGKATARYCEDGLAFDPDREGQAEPCDFDFKVDCSTRPERQQPSGSGVCLRQNGYYEHEDLLVCDKFYVCVRDRPMLSECSPGLHFDLETKTCNWPQQANRGACSQLPTLGTFRCPQEKVIRNGQTVTHPNFAHEDDCALFYACKNGKTPALSRCDDGLVFNTEIGACTEPQLVPDCIDYYKYGGAAAKKTTV